ncbi:lymphotoxin-alpha-like isoform X2 [Toxotes jaculatrix]|uniref:lymphotoxin-alpha-like isoform X2 n=1 Tax=Toxotes jaculatrix TaxID=941984 RepID=UPI001B3AF829|nr:lymphotoxin-alpha-like isoform X2 [Toxotes jaculatrix]
MERSDGSWRPIREWESSGMEEHGRSFCCEEEAGLQNTLIQHLRQKERRLQRMAHILAGALLLLVTAALALLVTVVLEGRGPPSADSQPMKEPESLRESSGISSRQQQFFRNPSAMLTDSTNISRDYLEWESQTGNAHLHGGFNYSNGNLVVPRNGIYRVFLQITYESKSGLKCDPDLSIVVYYFADSYQKNVPLLSSVDTASCSMERWSKSIYTAGMFSLEANSRLFVKSLQPELIVNKEHLVFFGAELISQ